MRFLPCFITARCFQNVLSLNSTTASISLPQFGCLKGEGDCWHVWYLLTQGARCSLQQKQGACPTGTMGCSPSGQRSGGQSCGCSSPSVQVREPPWGETIPEGLCVTSGGQVWRRYHPGISNWNLLQISETPAHSSYCCFLCHLNVCHLLSFSVASHLLCAWSHAEVHYLEKLN